MPARLVAATMLVLLTVRALPLPTIAAEPPSGVTIGWATQETEHVRYVVQSNDKLTAEQFVTAYGSFAEQAYSELALVFKTTAAQRIAIYVYADTATFDAAVATLDRNEIEGINAVADPERNDVSIALPRFAALSAVEAENQLRHATAHILVGIASGFNIPRGLDEGIAQYVERPDNQKVARIAAVVQAAQQDNRLPSWSELNRDLPPVDDKELIAAQAYAVVAYLMQHQGIAEFQRLLVELRTTPAWRDAMKVAYEPATATDLEQQWKEKVPVWAASEWRYNLIAGFDLGPAKELLTKGNYRGALDLLELAEQLFMALDDQRGRDEVEILQNQGKIGIQAEQLMIDTQQALERHIYDRAEANLAKAKAQYDQLPPEQRPDDLIATYEAMTQAGIEATTKLDEAMGLQHSWSDFPDARHAAQEAGETFASLGDEEKRTQAETVLSDLDTRQRRLVLMLGALAVLTVAWLALWLWARGRSELRWE